MAAWYGSKATTGLSQAIMKRKPAALRNIGIDLDCRAIDGFRCDSPVELHHGCAHRFLSDFAFSGRERVYSDPPYVRSTRRSGRRYRFDYTDAGHVALLGILKSLPCLRRSVGALRRASGRLALARYPDQQPVLRRHREAVVQRHARPGARGVVCGARLHAPPDRRAQGGGLGPAVCGDAPGGAACGGDVDPVQKRRERRP